MDMQHQLEIHEAHVNNPRTFEVWLGDPPQDPASSDPPTPIQGATVTVTVQDASGSDLGGVSWPLLAIEQGSPGWYVVTIPQAAQWAHMTAYQLIVTYGTQAYAQPPVVAYNRTLQQPSQAQLRRVAVDAGLSF